MSQKTCSGIFLCALLVAGTALSGCGGQKAEAPAAPAPAGAATASDAVGAKVAETIIEQSAKAQGEDVDVQIGSSGDAMSISVKGAQGDYQMTTGAFSSLPQGFPEDVPVYPGLKLQMTNVLPGEQTFSVVGQTDAKHDVVFAYYQKELPARGWTQQSVMQQTAESQPMSMLQCTKDSRTVHVLVMTDDEATTVSLTTGVEE
ncbi:MAG TPA: hypothetical protein PKI11_19890 [Candidatus Hydrogenedentes bacterium]|nr:hypothetical protein [Candidatus Hydrogenedentota bacterium]HNT86533.1 hypothetical protein [Candidatus Hydrogenedentota bacterium]